MLCCSPYLGPTSRVEDDIRLSRQLWKAWSSGLLNLDADPRLGLCFAYMADATERCVWDSPLQGQPSVILFWTFIPSRAAAYGPNGVVRLDPHWFPLTSKCHQVSWSASNAPAFSSNSSGVISGKSL